MNTFARILLALSVCLLGSAPVTADDAKSAFAKEAQGDWHVLAAHQNNKNIAADRVGSKVSVTADGVTWHAIDAKAKTPLLSAICARAPAPKEKKQADPNELSSTVSGTLCSKQDAKLAARWRITDNDVLLLLVEIAEYKGNRNGTYSGAAPADVLLICQRKPVPAPSKPDPKADATRLVGTWAVLGELDDANCARTRPGGNVEFTGEAVAKHGSYQALGKPSMEGTWKLETPQGQRGRIDINFKSGIEGNQGRSPSLYSFHGDDLLLIVYPEGGWAKEAVEKQELRKPPEHFGSDGNRNMWILRRKK